MKNETKLSKEAWALLKIRKELKELKEKEAKLTAAVKQSMEGMGKNAVEFLRILVVLEQSTHTSLDKIKLLQAVGEDVLKKCEKVSKYTKVKVSKIA